MGEIEGEDFKSISSTREFRKPVSFVKKKKMYFTVFCIESFCNCMTAFCFLSIFYKIVVTGPVVSVNRVKISAIFQKHLTSLRHPFLGCVDFLEDVSVFPISC